MSKVENYFEPPDPDSKASVRTPGYGITATRTWDDKIRIAIGPKGRRGEAFWIFLTPEDALGFVEHVHEALRGERDEE